MVCEATERRCFAMRRHIVKVSIFQRTGGRRSIWRTHLSCACVLHQIMVSFNDVLCQEKRRFIVDSVLVLYPPTMEGRRETEMDMVRWDQMKNGNCEEEKSGQELQLTQKRPTRIVLDLTQPYATQNIIVTHRSAWGDRHFVNVKPAKTDGCTNDPFAKQIRCLCFAALIRKAVIICCLLLTVFYGQERNSRIIRHLCHQMAYETSINQQFKCFWSNRGESWTSTPKQVPRDAGCNH